MTRISNAVVTEALEALFGAGGALEDATLGLFTNEWNFENEPVTADLTAPTFTGYAPGVIDAFTLAVDDEGNLYVKTNPVEFSPTNASNLPQLIRGWYLRAVTTNNFLAGGLFDDPITVGLADQVFHVVGICPWERKQPNSSGHAAIM